MKNDEKAELFIVGLIILSAILIVVLCLTVAGCRDTCHCGFPIQSLRSKYEAENIYSKDINPPPPPVENHNEYDREFPMHSVLIKTNEH